jgi:antitoxin VapB
MNGCHSSTMVYNWNMALNIKNPEAERLAKEVAAETGESLTAVVTAALRRHQVWVGRQQRRKRRLADAREFLLREVWSIPTLPADQSLSEDDVLGFGPSGA